MEKRGNTLELEIKEKVKIFLERVQNKKIKVISHFDTDGITSAAIMIQTLKRLDKNFSVEIVKRIEDDFIEKLPKDQIILFLDLASGSLQHILEAGIKDVFIIDHHEVIQEVPMNVVMINPELNGKEKISSSGLTYLFCKEINPKNSEFAKLAILGMIGDMLEKDIDKMNNNILTDSEIQRKRGVTIYPSTRPINKILEYSSHPYIPGISGDAEGVSDLLREVGLVPSNGKYKSLIELTEEEMSKLVTAIMIRNPKTKIREIIGDIFLIKFFNKLEDARELSAVINACSRIGETGLAIQFCMEMPQAKKRAESLHVKYKQLIISGLKQISELEKIRGNGFVIINARDTIRDTIIGTVNSIIANSPLYEEGTIITTMAYYDNKIKVSARSVGKSSRNLRGVLAAVIEQTGGNVGGHDAAAGCMILQEKEAEFIEILKKNLEIESIKVSSAS